MIARNIAPHHDVPMPPIQIVLDDPPADMSAYERKLVGSVELR